MKRFAQILFAAVIAVLFACGPSAKEEAEKAKQDSIRQADSIMQVEKEKADVAAKEKAKLDSIAQKVKADSIAAAEASKAKKPAKKEAVKKEAPKKGDVKQAPAKKK